MKNNPDCFRLAVADRVGVGERAAWWLRHLSSTGRRWWLWISKRDRVSTRMRRRRHLDKKQLLVGDDANNRNDDYDGQ